jgi:organic hydroperoxide reductase OsmC/OhrA
MSSYVIQLNWKKESSDFSYEKFNRNHDLSFSGDQHLNSSAAKEYFGNSDMTNPEELLGASLASCHMLTFLAVAAKSGFHVEAYKCKAEAILAKNEEGRISVTEINLTTDINFSGDKTPSAEQLSSLHEKAHRNCFIAQSLKTKVNFL